MSRKDFELIAAVLANTSGVERESRLILAEAFSRALASTNERFDATRFREACLRND